MKKLYRIKKNEDFQTIIHKKKSVANHKFVIYYLPNDEHMREMCIRDSTYIQAKS